MVRGRDKWLKRVEVYLFAAELRISFRGIARCHKSQFVFDSSSKQIKRPATDFNHEGGMQTLTVCVIASPSFRSLSAGVCSACVCRRDKHAVNICFGHAVRFNECAIVCMPVDALPESNLAGDDVPSADQR